MKRKLSLFVTAFIAVGMFCSVSAQNVVSIHAENDQLRTVPFYQAYAQRVNSIGVDVVLHKNRLYLADVNGQASDRTFEEVYVAPAAELLSRNGGTIWKDSDKTLQLIVSLRSDSVPSMQALVTVLKHYRKAFDVNRNSNAVRVVVSGNVPAPEDFSSFPDYIFFDGSAEIDYTPEQFGRVAMISKDFKELTEWNGKGIMIHPDNGKVVDFVEEVHAAGKEVRFFNVPEGVTVYYTFYNMGIDYVSTERPEACTAFFSDFHNKSFCIGEKRDGGKSLTGTAKLDKITRGFVGFANDRLGLSETVETYSPTYFNDGAHKPIRNVIMLIGDGMGINQITAAHYANKGLSLFNMKNIGFQQTTSKDAFTTDSAAGGSALATGKPHDNRAVSADEEGNPIPSLSDYFKDKGKSVGVVSLGNITDATPAAFYGHTTERDSSDMITRCLIGSRVDLLCGSGIRQFTDRKDGVQLLQELEPEFRLCRNVSEINQEKGRVLCIDEKMDEAAGEENLDLLAEATRQSIEKLQELSNDGFFLMVEGAKIDYAGHSNCFPGSVLEMLSFDKAIAECMKFADENGETLIVVTADHETGGLMLLDGDIHSGRVMGVYFTDDHTPSLIPVFSYGPYSDQFKGVYWNVDIPLRIMDLTK